MSSGGNTDNFADVCYEEIAKIKNTDWLEFARRKLNIPDNEIDDIKADYRDDIREQKFRMLQFWESHREHKGCKPSVALSKLVSDFQLSKSQLECSGDGARTLRNDVNESLILVYDKNLEPQISKTKIRLEEAGFFVRSVVCNSSERPSQKDIKAVDTSSRRAFILTGTFVNSSMNFFSGILVKSTHCNTLLLTKTVKEKPREFEHLPTTTINKLTAEDMYNAITTFATQSVIRGQLVHPDSDEEDFDDIPEDDRYHRHTLALEDSGFPDPNAAKYSNVLVIGRISRKIPQLRNLAKVSWLKVFDFDPKSRALGVLANMEEKLKSLRHVTISDAKDSSVESINDNATNWVFINGYCDSEFRHFVECPELDEMVVSKHLNSLVDHCVARQVLKVVVIWEPCNYDERLDIFMNCLRFVLKSQKVKFCSIICTPSKPDRRSELGQMVKRLRLEKSLCVVPILSICRWIKEKSKDNSNAHESKTLPQFLSDGQNDAFILSQKDFNWLSVCFDVIGSNESTVPDESLSTNGQDFLKGGKAEWQIIASMKYVANRDITPDPIKFVRKQYLETGKSGIVTISHPPGGGGTTFSRRLLWELRTYAPCLELLSMNISIEDVKNRLSFIRNETHLPAVVLVDGSSPLDVKTLLETCRYEKVVVLHVQRFYSSSKKLPTKKAADFIWVPENVSKSEANNLFTIFSSVRPKRKGALAKLTGDVNRGSDHCMFEYGLTAYDSEYHGVKSYVHGNLQISKGDELKPWHRVLMYLSLALYYGHCALPSQLFSDLLLQNDEDVVTLDDMPHQARKFVIEDGVNLWKISYFIVAKEILEQVLVKRQCPEYPNQGRNLTPEARQNLCGIVVDFIQFVKRNLSPMQDAKRIPSHIQDILTDILIKRNYQYAGENDEFGSRSKYSRIVEDVAEDESRKRILKTLVENFPSNAEFHAHLGRFYGINKCFQDAEKCFQDAFSVRHEEKKDSERRDEIRSISDGDPVLHRIHSMYAFYLNEQIRYEITEAKSAPNKKLVESILEKAGLAVENFRKSKDYYQKGCNPNYVYIGEIKVRLMIAGYANKITRNNIASLEKEAIPFCSLGQFVFESFSVCDQLLVQCTQYAVEYKIPQDELDTCINNFNTFFKSSEMALKHWMGRDESTYSKKCHIAVLKIEMTKKNGNYPKFHIYEDAKSEKVLLQLIRLYEGVLNDSRSNEWRHSYISNYMIEWLQAIRHPLLGRRECYSYTLKKVHSRVEKWDQKNEHGSLSTFYHYVLTTLLALNGVRGELTNMYSKSSHSLQERIKDVMIPSAVMERTTEWLACVENSQSFQNLIHRNLLGEWDGTFFKKDKAAKLKVCKGKISTCHIWYGHIILDGVRKPEVTVFFNPQRYGFVGSDSKQKIRVEFYLGFNPKHGAEAFQVKRLEKYECRKCRTPTEISRLGRIDAKCTSHCERCDAVVDSQTCQNVST